MYDEIKKHKEDKNHKHSIEHLGDDASNIWEMMPLSNLVKNQISNPK